MPRIAFGSDLHNEFDKKRPVRPSEFGDGHPLHGPDLNPVKAAGAHALVLAGDNHNAMWLALYLREVAEYLGIPIIAVLGNHEYYRSDIDKVKADLAGAEIHPLVHILDGRTVTLELDSETVRFIGATLWTDYKVNEDRTGMSQAAAMTKAQFSLNDHSVITKDGRRFMPEDALALHRTERAFIESALAEADDVTTVVVTHHAPSVRIEDQYKATPLSPCFASNLEALMMDETAPQLWIHGHTHEDSDVIVGRTRIVSRQRGYPGEKKFAFGIADI